jgi:hypothetical protein
MRRIFRFLDVDENFWSPAMEIERNTARRRRRNVAGRTLWRVGRRLGVPHIFAILRRAPAWAGLPLTSPLPPTVLTPELERRLESALAEDAARFRALTGRRFDSWSV